MSKNDNADILADGLPRILPPSENKIFQAILTLPKTEVALTSAVSAFLGRPVRTVVLKPNEPSHRSKNEKHERYDINCIVDGADGDQCNVEIQASPMMGDNRDNSHRNIRWRSVYNLSHLHVSQLGEGIEYGKFVKSYQVTLCNYRVFPHDSQLVERFTFRNPDGYELCDAVTTLFVDLTQARKIAKKPVGEMSDIEAWTVFLALTGKQRYSKLIDEIIKSKEGIAVAYETLVNVSQDPDERARYRSRMKAHMDAEHDKAVMERTHREKKAALEQKRAAVKEKKAAIEEKKAAIEEKKAAVKEMETAVKEKKAAVKEKDELAVMLAEKNNSLAEKDAEIARLRELLMKQ